MDLLWPGILSLLIIVPVVIAAYIWVMRRRRRFAVRYSSLSLVRAALPRYSRWRRHLPFALFLAALASLMIALGRPVSVVAVPTDQTTIILAIDVSRSMCSTDVQPNRILAAEAAAISFIRGQNSRTQIGIVAFSGQADLIRPPTTNEQALEAAINSLLTGRRTAIGSGILKSIDAIAEVDKSVAPSVTDTSTGVKPTPVPKGAYAPDIIVLLTDGANNWGPTPLEAAQQAADRGIRVYTIRFGTAKGGEFPNCDRQFSGRDTYGNTQGFGGGGGGPGGLRRGIGEDPVKLVAAQTHPAHYPPRTAGDRQDCFINLPP